jgi:hypothetical protein
MPPASRNHLAPTGGDTPESTAASSLERPAATADQNTRRCSRRATGGLPGERRAFRVDRVERRFPVVIATSVIRALRRPVESAQYLSIRYTERLAEAGIVPSVGSVGDSYDNALAETVIGLFKTEVIHRLGPWRSREAVEIATLEWVDWFNNRRLLEPIGNIPPAEAESRYFAMMGELSRISKQIEALPMPSLRTESKLMKYLPADTVVYVAIPNLSGTVADATKIFEERLRQSPALQEWWDTKQVSEIRTMAEKLRRMPNASAAGFPCRAPVTPRRN